MVYIFLYGEVYKYLYVGFTILLTTFERLTGVYLVILSFVNMYVCVVLCECARVFTLYRTFSARSLWRALVYHYVSARSPVF